MLKNLIPDMIPEEDYESFKKFCKYTEKKTGLMSFKSPVIEADGKIFSQIKNEIRPITNFSVSIITENIDCFEGDGDENFMEECSWETELIVYGKRYVWTLKIEDLESYQWIKQATNGRGWLENSAEAKNNFSVYLNYLILQENYQKKHIFRTNGWKKTSDGKWIYVTRDGVIGDPRAKICARDGNQLELRPVKMGRDSFVEFWKMREIVPNSNGIFLQFYSLLSVMTRIYQEVGVPVNFVVALIGKTNSFKTSCGRVFSKIFAGPESAEINFSSTKIAIMEELGKHADSMVLVDDITPKRDAFSEKEQAEKIELLIRAYGDRVPRKRSTYGASGEQAVLPVTGCCLLTGEHLAGVCSSLSRIVRLDFSEGDVRKEVLSKYQQETWVLPTFIYDFLTFVSDNMTEVMRILKKILDRYRTVTYSAELMPRSREILAIMRSILELFYLYALEQKFLDAPTAKCYLENDFSCIYQILLKNANAVREESPAVLIVKAILQDIREKRIEVCDLNFDYYDENKTEVVFCDEDFLRILPEQAWRSAKKYCASHGIFFPYSSTRVIAEFLDADSFILVTSESGKRRRTHKISSKSKFLQQRFFWIRCDKIEEVNEMEQGI